MVTQDREGEGDTRINPEDFASSSHALKRCLFNNLGHG
jgi:hypothetical protein